MSDGIKTMVAALLGALLACAAASAEEPPAEQPAANAAAAGPRPAMDYLELESSAIIGNRELPKVLYIVPWKSAELGDLPDRPVNSLLDEVLAPVDRDEFRRHVEYHAQLYGSQAQPGPANSQPVTPAEE